jgi:HD superfamily phosphodiesterase
MKEYESLKKETLRILEENLSARLHYHGLSHTLDVLQVCNQYIAREQIGGEEANLLRIGALVHDIGFTVSTRNHEERSMELAGPIMTKYGYSKAEIEVVKGLIRATRIPQSPQNHLEEIICDSDLDYLGRDDFYKISDRLYEELKSLSKVKDKTEWNQQQIRFLEAHSYHTTFARKHRQPKKEERIRELKALVAQTK